MSMNIYQTLRQHIPETNNLHSQQRQKFLHKYLLYSLNVSALRIVIVFIFWGRLYLMQPTFRMYSP
jgi:hypothetical protein